MTMHGYTDTLALFDDENTAFAENDTTKTVLEALIDRFGIETVLSAMGDVCYDKAAHVQENWNDRALAKAWEKNAIRCNAAALGMQPTS